jgi:hypothetical protein
VLATGGLGKSTLAYHVYTEMKNTGTFGKGSSMHVTFAFHSESANNAIIDEVRRWLAGQRGPVLLLLDNAHSHHQVDWILGDIVDTSFVLITSRIRDLVLPSDLYDMPIMNYSDALELFRWHSQGAHSSGLLKTSKLKVCTPSEHPLFV